jgi:hypothetical protein
MNHLFPRSISTEQILSFDSKFVDENLDPMRLIIARLKSTFPELHVWHPEQYLSSGSYDGIPCYSDESLLNTHGSLYLAPFFDYPIKKN